MDRLHRIDLFPPGNRKSRMKELRDSLKEALKESREPVEASNTLHDNPTSVDEQKRAKVQKIVSEGRDRKVAILCVEDEPIARKELEQVLRDQGYTVVSVSSGEDAMASGFDLNVKVGLILMDIKMEKGVIDGIEAARRIQERNREIPIILISAYAPLHQDRIAKYDLRFAAQVDKPLKPKKLLNIIETEFEKLSLRTQIQDEVLEVADIRMASRELLRELAESYDIGLLIAVIKDIGWIHMLDVLEIGDMVAYLNYIAFEDVESKLTKLHPGEFVAFLDGEPVGSAKDRSALVKQVYQEEQRADFLIVKVAEKPR